MHDVLLLLEHLIQREKTIIKLLLDCLYDVGSVNLVNKKLPCRPLNILGKSVARMSKPAFRIYALRWFRKNCPQLITKWLYSKVTFADSEVKPIKPVVVVSEGQSASLAGTETISQAEIKRLRSQVKYLSGISIGSIAALIGTAIWLGYSPRWESSQLTHPIQSDRPANQVEVRFEK